ncbi:MAG: hypothetical protein MI806_07385 [Minwuiales bacterium]|nr:hypothetical protein [Minwuiales bacterium]
MRQLRSIFGGLAAAFFVAVLAGCSSLSELSVDQAADRLVEAATPEERAVRLVGLTAAACELMQSKGAAMEAKPACLALHGIVDTVEAAVDDVTGFETAIARAAVPGGELLAQYGAVTGQNVMDAAATANPAVIALAFVRGAARVPASHGAVKDLGNTIAAMRDGSLLFEDAMGAQRAKLDAVIARF